MINLEGRLPAEGLVDAYIMLIHRANLDAMGGRAVATIEAHASAILRTVHNCQQFRKTPKIPPQGPMPMSDSVGMELAVELLFHLIIAVPRIKGESHIQFNSVRRPRATFTLAWELLPAGIKEGSTFSSNMAKVTITLCPTQQKWFGLMMRGTESRMGYTSHRQQPLGIGVVVKLLTLIKEEAEEQDRSTAREYLKVGAAVATAICASLRGPEVLMM
jgi:hypothetical protein